MSKEKFGSRNKKKSIDTLQTTAVLGTSHIIRKVLQSEPGSVNCGDRRWF